MWPFLWLVLHGLCLSINNWFGGRSRPALSQLSLIGDAINIVLPLFHARRMNE